MLGKFKKLVGEMGEKTFSAALWPMRSLARTVEGK